MLKRRIANRTWKYASRRHWRELKSALRNPREVQHDLLLKFLRRNAASQYGRQHGYADIHSIEQFQQNVPLVTYDDLQPYVEATVAGEPNVLTTDPVVMFETTSGSSGAKKFIPYTDELKREFQRAIGAWMYDLFSARPGLLDGSHYWAISPLARGRQFTAGGVPIGVVDDAEYLGRIERWVLQTISAVPASVAACASMEACRRETMRHLLRRRDLRLMSVWHPSFLSRLLEELPANRSPAECWPNLSLVSCWTSASAAGFVTRLEDQLPGVEIQGKGLLATEGVVTIPLFGAPAPVAALTSHFLEFIDDAGDVHLVDDLNESEQYEVAITTAGGFARYRLGDMVELVAPNCLKFVGRAATSDLCGEKLSEAFVGKVLSEAAAALGTGGFHMLVPEDDRPPRYVLLTDSERADQFAAEVERRLCESVHYDYCRRLGQLAAVEGVHIDDAQVAYLNACQQQGQRAGDVKPRSLMTEFGWRERMTGRTGQQNEVAHAG